MSYTPKYKPGDIAKMVISHHMKYIILDVDYKSLESSGFENTLCYAYLYKGQKHWAACHVLDNSTEKYGMKDES